jgi:hypothetical protein
MLGLDTLYEIDQKLRFLRGFQDLDFGGLPIIIFTGDFLQFGPIQQKGLLTDIERITEEDVRNKANDRKVQRHWRQMMAKKLWEKFDKVVILEEQKRAEKSTRRPFPARPARADTKWPTNAGRYGQA